MVQGYSNPEHDVEEIAYQPTANNFASVYVTIYTLNNMQYTHKNNWCAGTQTSFSGWEDVLNWILPEAVAETKI